VTEVVTRSVDGGIGIVCIDNPPVNALSNAVRRGIADAVAALAADSAVRALLLMCKGRTFIAGADIKEIGKPRQPPTLAELCDAIEACPKPIVAALHGTALGGGFEIALACHYRVADSEATFGLPEVKLGLIPGAGGANRLARLAGVEQALRMTITGEPITAATAKVEGIIDAIVGGELEPDSITFVRHLLAEGLGPRPSRAIAAPALDSDEFGIVADRLARRSTGEAGPAAAVEAVRRALTLPFDDAVAADREAFAALAAGSQSRALRHAFFAERQATKPQGSAGVAKSIASVAILGAGTMGSAIAMTFVAAGIRTTLIDRDADAVGRGIERIQLNYLKSVQRGSIDRATADARLKLIVTATDRSAAATADLVIEAVFEDMALKKEIFAALDDICSEQAILATNTSALDVDEMAAGMRRPDRFLGLHFFSPANVMRLVELVRAKSTSADTLATAIGVARKIGKVPVVSGNCDGFIGNRMVAKRGAQVDRLLLQGALPEEIDGALKAFGFPMGPLAINDMSGLDIGYAIRKRRGTKFPVADAVAESGRLGQKTLMGYYHYEPGSRTPLPDPQVADLIAEVSTRLGVRRRRFTPDEMVERMLYPLINEGARILEEGIATRASDLDAVWINGYGFPRWRGGPMFYADDIGLAQVVAGLRTFARENSDASLEPAPLLRSLAESGSSFTEWDRSRRPVSDQG
jgi:3-hydroxyacyl-CoA dehydrogenase